MLRSSLLEIQKLSRFLERLHPACEPRAQPAGTGSSWYSMGRTPPRLDLLLPDLDGYLHSDKRISDADPFDVIWLSDSRKALVRAYLQSDAKAYLPALEAPPPIDGFRRMELLIPVDWLLTS